MRSKPLKFMRARYRVRTALALRINLRRWRAQWAVERGPWHGPERSFSAWLKSIYEPHKTSLLPSYADFQKSIPFVRRGA